MSASLIALSEALRDAEVFVDGDWIESKDQDVNGDVRLIQLADVGDGYYIDKSNRFLTSDAAKRLKCTFLKPGDILLARMPDPLGRACIFPGDKLRAVTVVDVCIIRANPDKFDFRWLMHCLNAPVTRKQIDGYVTGTTRSRISRGNLGKVQIRVPPLPEQSRIAAILDQADALRAKRREAIAQLDSLTQSIFIEMFGDPVTNPKNLQRTSLGELIKLKSGDFLPASEMSSVGEYPVFGGNGINGFHDTYMFDSPMIVIGRVGAYCGCVHTTPAKSWITDNALYIESFDKSLDFSYLAFALEKAHLNQVASQSGQPLVSGGRIYPVKILVPDITAQQTFTSRVNAVDLLKTNEHRALAELNTLFASIQNSAFWGAL